MGYMTYDMVDTLVLRKETDAALKALEERSSFLQETSISRAGYGETLLHTAARAGAYEIAAYLLDKGLDANARGSAFAWTPLHCAAIRGQTEVQRLLIERGADLDARTLTDDDRQHYRLYHELKFSGDTPLHAALCEGHVGCAVSLVQCGASLAVDSPRFGTPLGYARRKGFRDFVGEVMAGRNFASSITVRILLTNALTVCDRQVSLIATCEQPGGHVTELNTVDLKEGEEVTLTPAISICMADDGYPADMDFSFRALFSVATSVEGSDQPWGSSVNAHRSTPMQQKIETLLMSPGDEKANPLFGAESLKFAISYAAM